MKKLFAILICLCLTLVPLNVTASGSLETVAADNTVTQTPIENGGITITPSGNTPEELAIQKIIAHKRALGEDVSAETMSASNEPEDDGIYYIKNYFSGKYLNVHYGVDANGTNVYQWTSDSSTEQKFRIKKDQANNCYKIYAMCSSNGTNRVLDVVRNGAALASGQNVDIWTPVDHTAQRMIFTYLTYDIYHIRMNANTNMYLTSYGNYNGTSGGKTATSAGNVFIQSFDVNDNQQWELILIDSPDPEPEPEPEPSTPYGWLDEVTANGIRGWAWCESLPEAALNVEIQLYKNNALVDTFSLVADIYRSDVAASDFGTGYYGFQYNIDWSEYPAGEYTVRAFAGINTPDTELHDSEMAYCNRKNAICVGVIDSSPEHNHQQGLLAASSHIESSGSYVANIYHDEFDYLTIIDFLVNDDNSIFVIRGHGGVNYNYYGNPSSTHILLTDLTANNEKVYFPSYYMNNKDLSNMEVALFIACSTGAGGVDANNLPSAAVENGAKVAIGFTDTIWCDEANLWTKTFFDLASDGLSIAQIINQITNPNIYDFVEKNMSLPYVVVCGDENYCLEGY